MSFIADIFGAKSAARGQKQAADASERASQASLAEQQRQYNQSRQDMMPWLTTGTSALGQVSNLTGLGGTAAQKAAMSQFTASPDYQFRLNEGNRQLAARNSALGTQDSGAAQKAALQYAQGLASSEYGNYYNRLAGLAGVGQTAAQNQAKLGQNYAGAVTGIVTNNAQNLASSYINRGNIYGNLWSNLGGQAEKAASMFFGGGMK